MLEAMDKKLGMHKHTFFYISIIAIIIYSNSLSAPFTLDDFRSITDNHAIRNPLDFAAIWNFYSNRFVLYFTLSLDFFFFKFNVLGYHLVNIFIHIINGILVFKILKIILGLEAFSNTVINKYKNLISFSGALLFIGHPVQVNAVTYIIQRTASLAAMFYLLAVLYFIKYRLESKAKNILLMFLFIVLGMLTKESTFSIPFMLLAVELILFKNASIKTLKYFLTKNKREIIIWCLIFSTLLVIPFVKMIQGGSISDPGNSYKASTSMSRQTYLLTEFNVIMTYMRLMLIPINQNLDYDYPLSSSFLQFPTYVSFAAIVVILLGAIALRKRSKLISLGILWFFIGLSVESSLIAINDVIFEHRLYLPAFGYVLFVTGLFQFISELCLNRIGMLKILFKIFIGLIAFSIVSNFVLTYKRNDVFSNSVTLWEDVVKKSPNKWRAHSSLGSNYLDIKDFVGAEKELKKALELNASDTTAYINLSKLKLETGDYNAALSYAAKSIEKADKSGYGYFYLAVSLYKLEKYDDAEVNLIKSLSQNPKLASAHKLLGDIYSKRGKTQAAVDQYNEALKYSADDKEIKEIRESLKNSKAVN